MPFDRERSIIAQNAANVAAQLMSNYSFDGLDHAAVLSAFEEMRVAIASKTWTMAQARETSPTAAAPAPPPPPPQPAWDESPFPASPSSAPPPAPQQPPTGPMCAHGARTYSSGTKDGKPWRAWFCALPKGTPGTCEPTWV